MKKKDLIPPGTILLLSSLTGCAPGPPPVPPVQTNWSTVILVIAVSLVALYLLKRLSWHESRPRKEEVLLEEILKLLREIRNTLHGQDNTNNISIN